MPSPNLHIATLCPCLCPCLLRRGVQIMRREGIGKSGVQGVFLNGHGYAP